MSVNKASLREGRERTYGIPTHCLEPLPNGTRCLSSTLAVTGSSHLSGSNFSGDGKTLSFRCIIHELIPTIVYSQISMTPSTELTGGGIKSWRRTLAGTGCGDQSSGKSSCLEAISGVPFPRKDTLCTRFATEVVLRKNSERQLL